MFALKLDSSYSIHIIRYFKNDIKPKSTFKVDELNDLDTYMKRNQWVDLANNVEKLKNGTEKDGIGKFLFEDLNKNTTEAQLASQLAAVFSFSGVWEHNNLKKNMKFKISNNEWKESIEKMYKKQLANIDQRRQRI